MITEMSREDLIGLGARCRADRLIDQAGYTLGLAALENSGLANLLPQGYVDEVKAVVDTLAGTLHDKAVKTAEARDATQTHHNAFRDAKVYRRKIADRARRARRMGKSIPDALLRISAIRTPAAMAIQIGDMVQLVQTNAALLPGTGVDALVAEGKAIVTALQSSDATQELKRLQNLPEAVRTFYEQKGLLYVGLKVINDAGHELHSEDHVAGARYNLAILHRRAPVRAEQPQPAPAPTPVPVG